MRLKKGFTLVELTVAIAILGIVGLLMLRLMFFSSRQYSRIDQEVNANEEVRMLASYVASEIHRHDKSQSVSFIESSGETYLQIYDTENVFTIEGITYTYEWVHIKSYMLSSDPRQTLEIAFGNTTGDLSSPDTDWYDVINAAYISQVVWSNEITQSIDGTDVLKAFDITIKYDISDSESDSMTQTITLRSEI